MYCMLATRPELGFCISALSKVLANPAKAHWYAGLRVLRYLKGTKDVKLELGGRRELIAFSDADWAGDIDDRRSTGGYAFVIGQGAVSWSAKRQPTVALSTLEAEYMAMTQATKEAIWLQGFLRELRYPIPPIRILGDNQGALATAQNPVYHARTKHIDIQHHFVREAVANGVISVSYVPTAIMAADILTKPISRDMHIAHCRTLGLELS